MNKIILSILLLIGGYAQAATDDDGVSYFELNKRVRYVAGRFDLETENRTLLTVPTRPTKPKSQAVLMYEGRPRPLEEAMLVRGRDGRRKVEDTESFPWCLHGQMSMDFEGSTHGGSGILVGPHHFLTAGHCVYKPAEGIVAANIRIRLGLNGKAALYGEVLGTKVYLYNQWMTSENRDFDIALVILNQSIGHETGWAGLLCLEDKELRGHDIHVTGYPGDKGFTTMWTMDDRISRVEREKLYCNIDTMGGQSGGAIWINKWRMPYIVGNHAYGGTLSDGGNFGVRLNEQKIRDIVGWIRDTLVIDEPVAPAELPAPRVSAGEGGREISAPVTTVVRREVPREPTRPSAGGGAGAGAGSGIGAEVTPSRIRPALRAYPPIAIGHEAEYDLFLSKILTYKPNKYNDIRRVDIPIRSLANPLDGTFDLSGFGDTGRYISIHTGYKKAKIPANANKVEIWLTPKFLVEANLGGDAAWMSGIMASWEQPYGIIWSWGNVDVEGVVFDYLVSGESLLDKSKNLHEKWLRSRTPSTLQLIHYPLGSFTLAYLTGPFFLIS